MIAKYLAALACLVLFLGTGISQEKTKSADDRVKELLQKYRALPEKAQLGKEGARIIEQLKGMRDLSPQSQDAIQRLILFHNLGQIRLALPNYEGKEKGDPKMFYNLLPYIEQAQPRLKWEYKVMPELDIRTLGKDDLAAGLNKLGDESWELVGLSESRFIFKRRK
jgi:hypothetical protein